MISLRKLFKKLKNEATPSPRNSAEIKERGKKLLLTPAVDPYIHKAASILNVHIPNIKLVDVIFECNIDGAQKVCAQIVLDPNTLPSDAAFSGGYYIDDTDTIVVASKYPKRDIISGTLSFVDHNTPELLYTVIHELRHVWQREYFREIFYNHNAIGMECLYDDAEVDADAFALAFIFSECTPFTVTNFPVSIKEIRLQAALDGGRRWAMAKHIAEEYHFIESGKLSAARG